MKSKPTINRAKMFIQNLWVGGFGLLALTSGLAAKIYGKFAILMAKKRTRLTEQCQAGSTKGLNYDEHFSLEVRF